MKCDNCKKDYSVWSELYWNGRYFFRDEAVPSREGGASIRVKVRKVLVCSRCQPYGAVNQPGSFT
jgi:hypothetical protein